MNADSSTPALPSDYPGKTAQFAPAITRLVYAIFGVQAREPLAGGPFAAMFEKHFASVDGPAIVEHLRYTDETNALCDVYLAYWSDPSQHQRWITGEAFAAWWHALPLTGPVGLWREIIEASPRHYQYGAGVPKTGGISALGTLVPCDKFGYWGGYRDRVPASVDDDFAPELAAMPPKIARTTLGKRLSVATPNNVCFIREGQSWEDSGAEERHLWQTKMAPVVEHWVAALRDNPADTGCFSVRDCQELAPNTHKIAERQSQIAFLLSLSHIERAARTNHDHLRVKGTFTNLYTAPTFEPRMHVWVEMFIVKRGDLHNEYVNCHPFTGFLPYFEPVTR